jgi:hypothetical protein
MSPPKKRLSSQGNNFNSIDGVLFKGPVHYSRKPKNSEEIEWIEHTLMRYPEAKPGDTYTVPQGVTNILQYAFSGQRYLKNITFPPTVIEIGEGAFEGCREDLQLLCPEGSYAHLFALKHKISHALTGDN